jgi:hypothetical protein
MISGAVTLRGTHCPRPPPNPVLPQPPSPKQGVKQLGGVGGSGGGGAFCQVRRAVVGTVRVYRLVDVPEALERELHLLTCLPVLLGSGVEKTGSCPPIIRSLPGSKEAHRS